MTPVRAFVADTVGALVVIDKSGAEAPVVAMFAALVAGAPPPTRPGSLGHHAGGRADAPLRSYSHLSGLRCGERRPHDSGMSCGPLTDRGDTNRSARASRIAAAAREPSFDRCFLLTRRAYTRA